MKSINKIVLVVFSFIFVPLFLKSSITVKNCLNHSVNINIHSTHSNSFDSLKNLNSGEAFTFFSGERSKKGSYYTILIKGSFLSKLGLSRILKHIVRVGNGGTPMVQIKSISKGAISTIVIEDL